MYPPGFRRGATRGEVCICKRSRAGFTAGFRCDFLRPAYRHEEFKAEENNLVAAPFEVKAAERMEVTVHLLKKERLPAVFGNIELSLEEDWSYRIFFGITSGDPTEGCFGCNGLQRFELDSTL